MTKTWIYIAIGATLLLGIVLGWWLGSRQNDYEVVSEKVRYVERPATTIYVEKPTLVREEVIVHDTVRLREVVEVTLPADTASIIADYLKRRAYYLDFSNDTIGIFKVDAVVEANRLTSATATIQPLQREVERTVVKVRKFRPFVSGGFAIGDNVGASLGLGGIIKDKHIVSAKYNRYGKQNIYGAEYGYIFGK
jgi:hypothetical protein